MPEDAVKISPLVSDRLSTFRTHHTFTHYAEFKTVEEFHAQAKWARERRIPLFILGGGSNVLFAKSTINTLILRNRLPRTITKISDGTIEVSSAAPVATVLAWCQERNLDSFYYLASVPATVGGAIAMNAGRGKNNGKTIFDYLYSLKVFHDGELRDIVRSEIPVSHRMTPFTGAKTHLIVSAVFKFPPTDITQGNPRLDRIQWSKDNQDYTAASCGSVFREFNPRVMHFMRGKRLLGASFSSKTLNWILNSGKSPRPIVWLIRATSLLHRLLGKRASLEIIEIK